ncbi:FAD-dependent oxidoreductase [Ectobacillus ponti]|uniref:FAD-dependent oxidoreductase n=1 Tax=Ectobacillus ponti TaxID=2961894 RepID=A0AA42BQ93_9BACI|nr:FAD-dependent oxidoreductase [Ectobacillus ponti]MCP8969627.1 FAD-dependent oxidoreductase [Ectobacillus ponti]
MPRFPEPYWRDSHKLPAFPRLNENLHVDVAVIGAGISGITTAYLLAKEGVKVALLDAGKILNGTTGHTTAKLTVQHSMTYAGLIQTHGQEKAKQYYEANLAGLNLVKELVESHSIDCDFSEQESWIYANTPSYGKKLEQEFDAYQKLGIPGEMRTRLPFEIQIENAIMMGGQAQFHPLKYLSHLVREFQLMGGIVYENTVAENVEPGPRPQVLLQNGHRVHCSYVVSSSHFPFYDGGGLYFMRMYADRSYVAAIKPKKEYPGGMFSSVDSPVRSFRYTPINGEQLLLVGGENHRTGQGPDTMEHYEKLRDFAEEVFGIEEFTYRWSAQDLFTPDNVPYIGRISSKHENIFVATGYRKWGMTSGTAAGLILRDLITKKESPYEELYTPLRFHPAADVKQVALNNVNVAAHFVAGKLDVTRKKIDELEPDEGGVVTFGGKRAGAYRDTQGKLHVVDTTCTHLGCEVNWNSGDRTWDCPCHGSRFSYDGRVVEGPADQPLKKLDA